MNYAKLAFTDAVKKLQEQNGSRKSYERMEQFTNDDGLSVREARHIQNRDSFYLATYGENGFPYIQHRGGPKGFLKVLNSQTLGFLDFSGNKQYISTGNIQHNNKVSLFLMDYPSKTRLKIYAETEILALDEKPEITEKLQLSNYRYSAKRVMLFHVKAFNWNCPQHIKPRYSAEEMEDLFSAQQEYIKTLESEIKRLRG
ncbi:pyridoxamine 5'-phosphate oxidase family protein [Chondrinema litorale]|uniref:pyridoxamine 5'-phosphate oxidase family protein n=1 Tax=Chondrinema litorale TaxID=2994555 RepID=UPI002542C918|nr:pyridoxamine 5'-phosphate oxidase family protein [Chondrinema litorale]UZR99407.1 pyridoxamine 5'-phosphate oxidase family protein [Chondrinema litorale]